MSRTGDTDPVLLRVEKGNPTPEELAALATVLMACLPGRESATRSAPAGRGAWQARRPAWRGPTAWSPASRPWTHLIP